MHVGVIVSLAEQLAGGSYARVSRTFCFAWTVEKARLAEAPAAPDALGPNPDKGLSAFDEDDAERFFGREALTQKLWETLLGLYAPVDGSPALRLIAEACRRLHRNLTHDEWQQYLGEVPEHATCPDLPLPGVSQ